MTSIKSSNSPSLFTAHFTHFCASCESTAKSVKREFSDQAWSALLAWNEIQPNAIDTPLCNDCYFNFRDVLIERADELKLSNRELGACDTFNDLRRQGAARA